MTVDEFLEDVATSAPVEPGTRVCAAEGCSETFTPSNVGFGKNRIYCDDHKATPKKDRPKKADRAPRGLNVNVNVGSGKQSKADSRAAELEQVRERAQWLVTTGAALLMMGGHGDDAADLQAGAAPWANAVKDLAAHEDAIRKAFTGGETSARMMAWVGFLIATGALLTPSLIRHGVIPTDNPIVRQMISTATEQPDAQAA